VQPNIEESRIGLILEGRVQGVGFRWWVRREANRLGLRGTVRNLPDGSVEVHAAGPADPLATFRAAIALGPPGACVSKARTALSGGELPPDFRVIG